MKKIEERTYPTWDNDLIMCPINVIATLRLMVRNTAYISGGGGMTHGQPV